MTSQAATQERKIRGKNKASTSASQLPDLGQFVRVSGKQRANGTWNVVMEVPVSRRPSGWLPSIPLPLPPFPRTGDLTNADEVAQIRADAAKLYEKLTTDRLVEVGIVEPTPGRHDFRGAYDLWQRSQHYKTIRPKTRVGYDHHIGLVLKHFEANGNPLLKDVRQSHVEAFLAAYEYSPTTKRLAKNAVNILFKRAAGEDWVATNPAKGIQLKQVKSKAHIWEEADVRAAAWACFVADQPSVAVMILVGWEIGQRVTDLRNFRWGAEYDPKGRMFRFYQSKTESYVTLQVSDFVADLLADLHEANGLYLFTDKRTGKPFYEARLGHVFAEIRKGFGLNPKLKLRALRHSVVVQLARAGCTIPEIASITGHSPFSAQVILDKYLPRDSEVAAKAQAKRTLFVA